MKIYESKTLIAAMEKRSKEYQSTREQFVNLKKAFQGIADLGDDFQGEGAENIKAFYRDLAGIVDDWLDLIDMQVQFLDGISAALEDAKLSGDTFVDMEFLENQLANAYKNSKAMVSQQKKDMKAILQDIHDILPLEVFSTDTFKQHLNSANDERKDTIKAVDDLDAALKEEYAASEINQQMVTADYTALIGATGKGKSASPIHYDAKAYRASEAYQLKDDVHKNAENYIQFKKDQAEARRIAKEQEELARKQEELANRPWYEKVLDAGSTFVGEITGYYDYKRASEGVDPVTGEKLTYGQRVAAGAMGAAGYIPVVGWFGKGAKGIKGAYSMYKAEKAVTTVDKALAAYRTPKTFQALKNSEKGLYGIAAANGFSETITGRDMFGNKISDEQRQDSLNRSIALLSPLGIQKAGKVLNVSSSGKSTNLYRGEDFPYEPKRPNGIGKSHISPETGNLVPANKTGMYQGRQVTVTEHVLGGYRKGGKSNSPYTSFTINQQVAKGYGENAIELDISALRKAIRSGEVKDIVILSPKQIERLIKNDTRQSEHWKNKALKWTQRDTEYFVKGEVPKQFIKLHPKE
ncbi:T7SS effector LXG polymorphic toxin [Bacillus glycinifermentans]|uniref:ribonuclease YeeF family protein n=1 Tax=Bacillus glycinifermentans TaxID=1664069 RepID=UPI002DC02495|nr:T7SS effector LXG polymorphic toxin [Bacillus glycinifermentans]MEC3607731.1 T7SS effector LXG polymorphic toxin [Bacillus glycinifermentans]